MDALMQGRVSKINELAAAVLADSQRQARQFEPGPEARLGLSAGDLQRYSFSRAIKSQFTSPHAQTVGGLERECHNELAKRFDVPLGSIAIPLDVLEYRGPRPNYLVGVSAPQDLSFIDQLRNRSIAFRLGVQRLTDLKDDVAIPRQITSSTLSWLSPTGSVSASDSTFGQVSATPKSACVIAELSEQLMRQSSADTIIKAGLVAVTAVGLDLAIISGAGGLEPLGIMNTPGVGSASGTSLGYAALVGVQKTVADANAIINPDALGYATTPTVAEQLKNRQRFANTDSPLWRGALHQGDVEGVQAVATKQMGSATLLYGDWSTVYVGEWGPLMLSADRGGTRFNQALIGIRALWMVDVFVTAPTAFVKMTSIT